MRNISDYLNALLCEGEEMKSLAKKVDKLEKETKEAKAEAKKAKEDAASAEKEANKAKEDAASAEKEANKAEESIKSEEDFRDYAKNKFEEVFGDDLDEDKMNEVVGGILKKYKEDADKGDWGKLVGVLNKSFGGK